MGFGFSGTTVLKYSKKYGCFKNSTGTCEVYSGYAKSYNEKIVISKEYKIGNKKHNIIFYNTYNWSSTTTSHTYAIQGHKHLGSGIEIYLNFNGSMNRLDDLCSGYDSKGKNESRLNIAEFKKCELDENLRKFIKEYFPKEAKEFIKTKEVELSENIRADKSRATIKRLAKKIGVLGYSSPNTLAKAIDKFRSITATKTYLQDTILRNHPDKISRFFSVIDKNIDIFANYDLSAIIDFKKLQVFTELGEQNENIG